MTMDITICNTTCNPGEQKMATFKNWLQKLHKLPLNDTNKTKELNTVINIAENKGYSMQQIIRLKKTKLRGRELC
jgi:hypothetical protein